MLDRQRLLRHAPDSALLLVLIFLTLSLVGYDPADVPGVTAEPPNLPPSNPCGPVGAMLADRLFRAIGWSSYLVLVGIGAAVVLLFRRRGVPEPGLRLVGFGLVLAVTSALVHKFGAGLEPSPPVGGGGFIGALAATFLEGQFGPAGMYLILAAAGVVGLALCQDALLLWPIQEIRRAFRGDGPAAPLDPAAVLRAESPLILPPSSFVLTDGDSSSRRAPRPALNRPPLAEGLVAAPPARSPGPVPAIIQETPAGPVAVPDPRGFLLPSHELLEPPPPFPIQEHEAKIHARAMLLERTLLDFGYQVRVVQIDTGPVITQFEIELEAGLRVSRIISLADDLAIALAVPSVRIVAPIPGKTTVGIEVPNERRAMVRLGEVIAAIQARPDHAFKIPLFLGKDVKGIPLAFDLADMPHLLIAGRTGTGKSVCLNAMILSILMTKRPEEVNSSSGSRT
jgi:S-DNA-T family DNA segregation ATPase FtsK/SpoIIIE